MFPDGFGDENAGGVEDTEFTQGGFRVELDDLGIIADDGNWTAEWGAGHLVAAQIHVFPLHLVYLQFSIEAIQQHLPFRRDGDIRHCLYREREREEDVLFH